MFAGTVVLLVFLAQPFYALLKHVSAFCRQRDEVRPRLEEGPSKIFTSRKLQPNSHFFQNAGLSTGRAKIGILVSKNNSCGLGCSAKKDFLKNIFFERKFKNNYVPRKNMEHPRKADCVCFWSGRDCHPCQAD